MPAEERYTNYDPFAWAYERHWSLEVPPQLLTVVERLLVPCLPEAARVLDVCCGTGHAAAELQRRGFAVTGLDGSERMLRYARRRAPGASFVLADARAFSLDALPFDAAFSIFDSLNHVLRLDELSAVFRNVYAALAPGGLFLFDMNMEAGFLEHWAEHFAIVEDDNVCVLRGTYDSREKLARYDITMFRRAAAGAWRRDEAVVLERCYSAREIRGALRRAGFVDVSVYDAERELGLEEHVGRSFFLTRKAG